MKRGVGRFSPQPPLEGRRDRDARSEIQAVFLGTLKGKREDRSYGGEREEGHDDVDGGLKGNERGMMQAWVRIAVKARDGRLCRREHGRKERRGVRGPGNDVSRVYVISNGGRLFGA